MEESKILLLRMNCIGIGDGFIDFSWLAKIKESKEKKWQAVFKLKLSFLGSINSIYIFSSWHTVLWEFKSTSSKIFFFHVLVKSACRCMQIFRQEKQEKKEKINVCWR